MHKIIGGKYKNHLLPMVKQRLGEKACRPSTSKLREALFSILTSGAFYGNNIFDNAKVIDLFCGTGALGLEAMSRGAQMLTAVDCNKSALDAIFDFALKLDIQAQVCCYKQKIKRLEKSLIRYDVVFLDPPYLHNYITNILHDLVALDWLNESATIVVEASKKEAVALPAQLEIIKDKYYGATRLLILQLNQPFAAR
ncbi:Ribosomal RNA small subunit methyltransferase D [Rickettsiales endosymbiont of Paramecium tredecaurelia]|uniref:16S rRNA (guanine(966)-N(2))-methyltransferase RsmD n=1 Tax=Candidatus Sarmatiella mevalonica TaxID=2770581 RepID=UPI0019206D2E|nr:16S rRNA (guanine(966)-N(2))-methyltransferase RsmD [Candidatus Sarmatiella mevalonica]MBL3284979.1 Ribosomal RNA small subunit methyltransferase D [Candidatus Sarmatiella mevalonica]